MPAENVVQNAKEEVVAKQATGSHTASC